MSDGRDSDEDPIVGGGGNMAEALMVTKEACRRFLLRQMGLGPGRLWGARGDSARVLEVVRELGCVQIDPVATVEPNHHLVLSLRVPHYHPELLHALLKERRVFEYWAQALSVLPMEDYPLWEPIRQRRRRRIAPELETLRPVVEEILTRLRQDGPLPSRAFVSTHRVEGYWDNRGPATKATSHALSLMADAGDLVVVDRVGRERYFDLTERAIPRFYREAAAEIDLPHAVQGMVSRYARAYRLFHKADARLGWQTWSARERERSIEEAVGQGQLVPVAIGGVARPYYIRAEDEEAMRREVAEGEERWPPVIRFIPPLDNLLWSRSRISDLFEFDYTWEIYIPAHKRRFGPYTMPILEGDRLMGRVDLRLDRERRVLCVRLLSLEPDIRWGPRRARRVEQGLEALATHLGAQTVEGLTDFVSP